jgi:hypothetical protein
MVRFFWLDGPRTPVRVLDKDRIGKIGYLGHVPRIPFLKTWDTEVRMLTFFSAANSIPATLAFRPIKILGGEL